MNQNPYQKILQKTFESKTPINAHFELTYRCNLSCAHCYAVNRNGYGELTTAEVESVLAQLAEMNCLFLTVTGGEILARNDIVPILRSARRLGFATQIFTNGTLMTPELADSIAEIEPTSVEMSLYAMNGETHDAVTGLAGSHGKTVRAIRLCRERNLRVVVKTMLMKMNSGEYAAIKKFATEVGAQMVVDFILSPADDGGRPMERHGLSEEEIYRVIRANAERGQDRSEAPQPSDQLCGAGSNTVCVNPFGEVFPCLAIRQSVGNVRTRSLRDIWRDSSLDETRKMRYAHLKECANCQIMAYCPRCSGVALAECGNLLAKSEAACVVAKATKRALEEGSRDENGK